MNSRWKKVWADFWGNKTRTFLMVITILVGVFAVGFVSNMSIMTNQDMDADYNSVNPAEATIYAYPLDDSFVEALHAVPGVGDVEGRAVTQAFIRLPDEERVNTQFISTKSAEAMQVNRLKPTDPGGTLPTLGEKEFLLDRSANSLKLEPGDMVNIELSNGKVRQLRFGGYVHNVAGFPYNMMGMATAYITPETMVWLGGSEEYSQVIVSVTGEQTDQEHVSTVAQAVSDRIEKSGTTVTLTGIYNPGHHFAWEVTQGIMFILTALGWMTVLLSSLLIINSITALMSQQTRQIGIMKAVGGETRQIVNMYIVLVLAFGLVAFVVSVPLSSLIAYNITSGMAVFLNFDSGPRQFFPQAVIQQAIVAFVIPLLAALAPILNNVRMTVRETLSDYGIRERSRRKKKVADVGKHFTFIPRPIQLSLRNAFRRRVRLGLTLVSLILGGGIFISVYNLWEAFDKTIIDTQGYFLSDVNIAFSRAYRFDKVEAIAMSVPGVESVEGWIGASGQISAGKDKPATEVYITAPPSTSRMIKPVIVEGRWLQPGDENAIVIGNHLLSARPELKVGDWVTMKVNEEEKQWQIIGIFRMAGNTAPPPIYTSYEYLSRLMHQPGQAYSVRVLTSQHDLEFETTVSKQLEAAYRNNGIPLEQVVIGKEWAEQQRASTDILAYFMLVMAVLIAIVGGLGLMSTMSINILERTREIGVMRAIGASNWNIQAIVITEGMVVGVISWLFAILLAMPLTSVLAFGVGTALFQAPVPYIFSLSGLSVWLIGVLLLAAFASALPARRASSLTVRDTLAYE
jgi:putative ABC transport system permease protein